MNLSTIICVCWQTWWPSSCGCSGSFICLCYLFSILLFFFLSLQASIFFLFFSFLEKENCVLSWLPFHLFVHLRWPNTSQKSCLMVKILQTLQSTVHVCLIIINCLRLLFKTSACSCSLNRQEIRSIRQLGYHFLASKNQRYVIDNPKKEQKVIEIWLINVIM